MACPQLSVDAGRPIRMRSQDEVAMNTHNTTRLAAMAHSEHPHVRREELNPRGK
jgi:hypothetical protein